MSLISCFPVISYYILSIHDGSLTAGMSVLVMIAAVVDMHDDSVDTVDWPLQSCMNLAVVVAAAGNTLLVDVENACLVVLSHASF